MSGADAGHFRQCCVLHPVRQYLLPGGHPRRYSQLGDIRGAGAGFGSGAGVLLPGPTLLRLLQVLLQNRREGTRALPRRTGIHSAGVGAGVLVAVAVLCQPGSLPGLVPVRGCY